MRSTLNIVLVTGILCFPAPLLAATAENVQKAFENCVVAQSHGNRQPTPEAARQWALDDCTRSRQNSCPTPDSRWCDSWVNMQLGDVRRTDAERLGVKLPH